MIKKFLQNWLEIPPKPVAMPHQDPAGIRPPVQPLMAAHPNGGMKAVTPALPAWISQGCKVYTVYESPDQFNVFTVPQSSVCYFNAVTPPGLGPQPNTWCTCDVSNYVPAGALAVNMAGIMIITHGNTQETADLEVFFRRDATVTSGVNYNLQCIEPFVGGGQRCCASIWVPLTPQGTFQWMWTAAAYPSGITPTYQYPTYSAYGMNLRVVAYAAPN